MLIFDQYSLFYFGKSTHPTFHHHRMVPLSPSQLLYCTPNFCEQKKMKTTKDVLDKKVPAAVRPAGGRSVAGTPNFGYKNRYSRPAGPQILAMLYIFSHRYIHIALWTLGGKTATCDRPRRRYTLRPVYFRWINWQIPVIGICSSYYFEWENWYL